MTENTGVRLARVADISSGKIGKSIKSLERFLRQTEPVYTGRGQESHTVPSQAKPAYNPHNIRAKQSLSVLYAMVGDREKSHAYLNEAVTAFNDMIATENPDIETAEDRMRREVRGKRLSVFEYGDLIRYDDSDSFTKEINPGTLVDVDTTKNMRTIRARIERTAEKVGYKGSLPGKQRWVSLDLKYPSILDARTLFDPFEEVYVRSNPLLDADIERIPSFNELERHFSPESLISDNLTDKHNNGSRWEKTRVEDIL